MAAIRDTFDIFDPNFGTPSCKCGIDGLYCDPDPGNYYYIPGILNKLSAITDCEPCCPNFRDLGPDAQACFPEEARYLSQSDVAMLMFEVRDWGVFASASVESSVTLVVTTATTEKFTNPKCF